MIPLNEFPKLDTILTDESVRNFCKWQLAEELRYDLHYLRLCYQDHPYECYFTEHPGKGYNKIAIVECGFPVCHNTFPAIVEARIEKVYLLLYTLVAQYAAAPTRDLQLHFDQDVCGTLWHLIEYHLNPIQYNVTGHSIVLLQLIIRRCRLISNAWHILDGIEFEILPYIRTEHKIQFNIAHSA